MNGRSLERHGLASCLLCCLLIAVPALACSNQPPVADIYDTETPYVQSVELNAPVTLDGSDSYDPDGDNIETYQWTVYRWTGSGYTYVQGSTKFGEVTTTSFSSMGLYRVYLDVEDEHGAWSDGPDQCYVYLVDTSISGDEYVSLAGQIQVSVSMDPSDIGTGTARLSKSCSGSGNVNVYRMVDGNLQLLSLPWSWPLSHGTMPSPLYVEGTSTSSSVDDVTLTLSYVASGETLESDSMTLTVVDLNITEPDGSPLADNHFAFDGNANWLQARCDMPVTGTGGATGLNAILQWAFPWIDGTSTSCSPPSWMGPSATLTYTKLPPNNSDFGTRGGQNLITLYVPGCSYEDTQVYELFYSRDAVNHPPEAGEQNPTTPNWYYYWKHGDVVADLDAEQDADDFYYVNMDIHGRWTVLLACCTLSRASTVYVDSAATGRGDGTSWVNAFTSLQDALRVVASADEVLVAQGVYRPDHGTGLIPGDQQTSFRLDRRTQLRGGYCGCVGPDPNARDIHLFESILSGDLAENDVDVKTPREMLNESSRRENSSHVVTVDCADQNIVLDGFTITAGHFYTTIRDGERIGGAGLSIKSGSPTVVNCTFRGNACRFGGGGVSADQGSAARFSNCTFVFNYAASGGGLDNYSSSPVLTGCRFLDNYGSAISNRNGSSPAIAGCTFQGNTGGAVQNRASSNPVMTGCTFIGNTGGLGGAVDSDDKCEPVMIQCAFSANRAEVYGGAIHIGEDSRMNIRNCLFVGNMAPAGGAIFSRRYTSNAVLVNSTLSGNRATEMEGSAIAGFGEIILRNCIVRDSIQGALRNSMLSAFCNITGNPQGEGSMDTDPLFAAPGYWDPNGTLDDPNDDFWIDGDYHLKSQAGRWDPNSESWVKDDVTSPCIDAGDPNSPVGEEPFPNGGRTNMGAYGGTAEASKSYFGEALCQTIIAGDINGDCRVDFVDLAIMASHWSWDPDARPSMPSPDSSPR